MPDPRIQRAQQIYWQVQSARQVAGSTENLEPLLREMATLHEAVAEDRLGGEPSNPDGWTDMLAAITSWADAREFEKANSLIARCRNQLWSSDSKWGKEGRGNIDHELEKLRLYAHSAEWRHRKLPHLIKMWDNGVDARWVDVSSEDAQSVRDGHQRWWDEHNGAGFKIWEPMLFTDGVAWKREGIDASMLLSFETRIRRLNDAENPNA